MPRRPKPANPWSAFELSRMLPVHQAAAKRRRESSAPPPPAPIDDPARSGRGEIRTKALPRSETRGPRNVLEF